MTYLGDTTDVVKHAYRKDTKGETVLWACRSSPRFCIYLNLRTVRSVI